MTQISGMYRRGMRRIRARSQGIYSNFDEQLLIQKYIDELGIRNKQCVDIAAGDGISMSNAYALFRKGWRGLAVEYDPGRFASLARSYRHLPDVNLAKCKVTPENVVSLLKANQLPRDFGLLNLDIDGYDFFVLEQMLKEFRPSLICVEINEKIPPPIKFTVKWNPDYFWKTDHFYGQSLSQLCTLCPTFGYALVDLHYNNAFLVPSEINRCAVLTAEAAYRKGYLDQPDRKERFPWNANMEELLTLRPEEAIAFLNRFFSEHRGEFICEL